MCLDQGSHRGPPLHPAIAHLGAYPVQQPRGSSSTGSTRPAQLLVRAEPVDLTDRRELLRRGGRRAPPAPIVQ